jgi:hypothetical protein
MATISTKQLTDELSLLSKKVDTSQIEGTLEHVGTFLETSASSTLASIDLNEVKGGLKSLTQDLDNVADILSTQTAPTITKLDESASDLIDNLKTDISSIDLGSRNRNAKRNYRGWISTSANSNSKKSYRENSR